MLWDFFATLVITIMIVEMTATGYLPPWIAGPMLLVFVAFRAVGRAFGGVRGCLYYPFTILFFGVLIIFVAFNGGIGHIWVNVMKILSGGFEKILVQIINLAAGGHIGFLLCVLAIGVLIFLKWFGLQIGSVFLYHTVFSLCMPFFILLIFLSSASEGDWREAVRIGGGLLTLLVLLEMVYLWIHSGAKAAKNGKFLP